MHVLSDFIIPIEKTYVGLQRHLITPEEQENRIKGLLKELKSLLNKDENSLLDLVSGNGTEAEHRDYIIRTKLKLKTTSLVNIINEQSIFCGSQYMELEYFDKFEILKELGNFILRIIEDIDAIYLERDDMNKDGEKIPPMTPLSVMKIPFSVIKYYLQRQEERLKFTFGENIIEELHQQFKDLRI